MHAHRQRPKTGGGARSHRFTRTHGAGQVFCPRATTKEVDPPEFPPVDWSRCHLQVLFVDRSDTLRARVASGLFDSVAQWSGFGRALHSWTAGVEAAQQPPLSTRAALIGRAASLGIDAGTFARPVEAFEASDLDRFDLVVALDAPTRAAMLAAAGPDHLAHWSQRVRVLSEFGSYAPNAVLLREGGSALLPRRMSAVLAPALDALRARAQQQHPGGGGAAGVARPDLRTAGPEEWNAMVAGILLGAAGLAKYLMDSFPDDEEFNAAAQWLW